MLLTIVRDYKEKATPGVLFVNHEQFCHTLELPKGKCIPEGDYPIHLTYSPRFKRIIPLVFMVPGFSGVRIHWGNFVKDTQGCPLVGYDKGYDAQGVDCVLRSRICFEELNRWLTEANKNQVLALEIRGPL